MRSPLPTYNHQLSEAGKNRLWQNLLCKLRQQRSVNTQLLLPPPNITGALHLGHAWNAFLQDFLMRYSLLRGEGVSWHAGMDHAGIATQIKISKSLATTTQPYLRQRGRPTRQQLISAIWTHRTKYEVVIRQQWQRLGLLLDPLTSTEALAFTLDQQFQRAVNTIFVRLYQAGLVYEGQRVIMWDPVLKTALSNIEIATQPRQQWMYYFKYVAVDQPQNYLIVATSRPETMFADQALVVNDQDQRFTAWVGQQVRNPATGQILPVIADAAVDIKFGSGVMKCTPGHDQVDFEVGRRHGLAAVVCIDVETDHINHHGGRYAGLNRLACRQQLVAALTDQGFLLKKERYQAMVPVSHRSQIVVEPILSQQWFVKTTPLAAQVQKWQQSAAATQFVPARFAQVLRQWMTNVQDWCISRQISWGHRLPVWRRKTDPTQIYVGTTPPLAPEQFVRVPDVFDTWFSSALCPLVTSGWPHTPPQQCRSLTVLVTGYDIIFFWVARMLMFSLYVTGRSLIQTVLVHGLVRDHTGRKMSKSLNNGVDPLTVIKEYGVDSLRLFLITNTTPGLDLKFNPVKLKAGVSFIYKLWNTARYVMMRTINNTTHSWTQIIALLAAANDDVCDDWNRWIVQRWQQVSVKFHANVQKFEYGVAFAELRQWLIHDFCDWYLEVGKLSSHPTVNVVLRFCLLACLRTLHPFTPFVSETLFGYVTGQSSILAERYQVYDRVDFTASMNLVAIVQTLVFKLRQWRKEQLQLLTKQSLPFRVVLASTWKRFATPLKTMNHVFKKLARSTLAPTLQMQSDHEIMISCRYGQILLSPERVIDWKQELKMKEKQLLHIKELLTKTNNLVQNVAFCQKAQPAKLQTMLKREQSLRIQIKQIHRQIDVIKINIFKSQSKF